MRELNLAEMSVALEEESRRQNDRAREAGAVAYAPPAVRREHGARNAIPMPQEPPQLEWPATVATRPELEKAPETPNVIHEAVTDLAHTYEACAIAIEQERDKMLAETMKVADQATEAAATIRAMSAKTISAITDQTKAVREASVKITDTMKSITPSS